MYILLLFHKLILSLAFYCLKIINLITINTHHEWQLKIKLGHNGQQWESVRFPL